MCLLFHGKSEAGFCQDIGVPEISTDLGEAEVESQVARQLLQKPMPKDFLP